MKDIFMFFKKTILCAMIGTYLWCQASENNQLKTTFTCDDMQELIKIINNNSGLKKRINPFINSEEGLRAIVKCVNDKNLFSHPALIKEGKPYLRTRQEVINHFASFYTDECNKEIQDIDNNQRSGLFLECYYTEFGDQTQRLFDYAYFYNAMKKQNCFKNGE